MTRHRPMMTLLLALLVIFEVVVSFHVGPFHRVDSPHRWTTTQAVKQDKAVGSKVVSVDVLKNIELMNYKGEKTRVSSLIKSSDKAVVVFLRHLG